MAKVILYIATSEDGFIADKDGGVDWMPSPDTPDEHDELGYEALLQRISTIVMGSKSYKQILGFGEWAWSGKTTYVFSHTALTTERPDVFFVDENVKSFIDRIKTDNPDQDIWLLGGAQLITSFAKEKLIDECVITLIPMVLGEGIALELPYQDFVLTQEKICLGFVQKHYIKRAEPFLK